RLTPLSLACEMARKPTWGRNMHARYVRDGTGRGIQYRLTPVLAAFSLACVVFPASGAERLQLADLADLTLEELVNVEVTSVSRRAERLADAPASIFVINAEDIRRSGATSLADALRI